MSTNYLQNKKHVIALAWTWIALLLIGCSAISLSRTDFAGLVDIGGDRKIYLECRGIGSPTIVLVSGTGGASDEWTHTLNPANPDSDPIPSDSAIFPQVSRFTRVCAYDRPGTARFDGALSSSSFVSQPTTAQDGVSDLHALLNAAKESGPYILVGASWGGMIVKLYASTYPDEVSGLVFVDSASEFLETTFTPTQWADWMNKIQGMLSTKNVEVPDYESSVQQVRNRPILQNIPTVVLTSDKPWDLQVGESGSTWSAWLEAQVRLASQLGATHISNTNSGHGIAIEQPQLVVDAIRRVVDASRSRKSTSPN